MKRINKAKRLVMQQQFRSRVVRDRTKYSRKSKHRKAPVSGGFFMSRDGLYAAKNHGWRCGVVAA